jgi:hypothetical protein
MGLLWDERPRLPRGASFPLLAGATEIAPLPAFHNPGIRTLAAFNLLFILVISLQPAFLVIAGLDPAIQ